MDAKPDVLVLSERRQAMNRVLSDYLAICNKFRTDGLSKDERKQRHALLSEWEKTYYKREMLSLGEIQDFWDNHNDICWNRLFISKVICPAIADDLANGGYDGLRFLFHCFHGHESSCIHSDSPLAIFCDYSGSKYQPFQLADILLEHEPDNVDALRYKYDALKYFLESSIHEMPSGVLNCYDGASVSDIPAMIEDTNEFERISRKLNMPLCENLVKNCRRYYKAYGDYLRNLDRYGTFEDFLRSNKISYHSYTSRYDYE